MFTRLLATTTLALGLAISGYADDTQASKQDGQHAQLKTAEDVANKLNKLNHKEIECAKLGQRKSENAEVKEFARVIESDHMRANEQVQQFAQANNIDLKNVDDVHAEHKSREGKPGDPGSVGTPGTQGTPGNQRDVNDSDGTDRDSSDTTSSATADRKDGKYDDKEKWERLESLSGEEFDREYTTMMAKAHGKAVRMLTDAQDQVEDAKAKELIASILPDLQKHKEQAAALSRKLGGNPDVDTDTNAATAR